ncbi:MAG: DUF4386 family protein [Anaerolineales bacterium]
MMKNLQKMGGIAALYAGVAYLVGFALYIVVLNYSSDIAPIQQVASFVDNRSIWHTLNLLIYTLFGFFLVVLALALFERLKTSSPAIMQTATAIGLIWAGLIIASGMIFNVGIDRVVDLYGTAPDQAASVWVAIDSVRDGLGGGNEIVGGVWLLLVSWAALKAGGLPRVLNYLGVAVAAAGILSAIPALSDLTDVFGLTQIVWFIWLGIVMLRTNFRQAE